MASGLIAGRISWQAERGGFSLVKKVLRISLVSFVFLPSIENRLDCNYGARDRKLAASFQLECIPVAPRLQAGTERKCGQYVSTRWEYLLVLSSTDLTATPVLWFTAFSPSRTVRRYWRHRNHRNLRNLIKIPRSVSFAADRSLVCTRPAWRRS